MKEKENGIELPEKLGLNETEVEQPEIKGLINVTLHYIKIFFAFLTVEPFLICFVLPNVISSAAVQKLNTAKACLVDLNYSELICSNVTYGILDDNITATALLEATRLNTNIAAWKEPFLSGVPALLILFVGAWSDRTGNRKALMMVPLIGELLTAIGLVLATYYFYEWQLWITAIIEGIFPAFCGGLSIALMGSFSYVADVTTQENRTLRLGIVGLIVTLSIPVGTVLSGILTETIGYYGIFGLNIVGFTLGLIYTYFRVHDVRRVESTGTFLEKLKEFFHPKNVWDTISLVVLSRGRRLAKILLVIWSHIVIQGPVAGKLFSNYYDIVT